ncbi:50S ribosomal protein L15 [Candidatus Peregrinibacteria bacterium]|nr:50S ribosomal protein L15 [Candidatus Peregrinibacteria bacterium]
MEALLNLKRNKGAVKSKRRLGRGNGSTLGSNCGRGENGQKSRTGGNIKPGFTGGDTPLYRKMPKLKGFKNPNKINFQVINLTDLDSFDDNSTVDLIALYEKKLISKKDLPVKLLGNGDVSKKINVKLTAVSNSAKDKIEKKGGTVEILIGDKKSSSKKATDQK